MFFHLIFNLDEPYKKIYQNACNSQIPEIREYQNIPVSGIDEIFLSSKVSAASPGLSSEKIQTETIFLCDRDSSIKEMAENGYPVIAVSHNDNRSEELMGTPWLILSPDALTLDFLNEVCYRHYGLPMPVTETSRCKLRELSFEDYPSLLTLQEENVQNPDGCFFPINCNDTKEFLLHYIQNQYPFYGFGIYAILHKSSEEFMGIAGFSSVTSIISSEESISTDKSKHLDTPTHPDESNFLDASDCSNESNFLNVSDCSNGSKSLNTGERLNESTYLNIHFCPDEPRSSESLSVEVSYALLRKWQGKGFASEVVEELLRFGKQKKGYEQFTARIHPSNTKSLRLAKKLGIIVKNISASNTKSNFR